MLTYSTYTQTLGEASSGIKVDDLWKRDNLERFISKATSGELVDKSNNKIPALSKNNELIKSIKTMDNPPEGDELVQFKKMFQQHIGAFSKVPKAENGFSPASRSKPSGAQWEALIAIAVNKISGKTWNSGPEWDDVGKFWGEYEKPSMKLGQEFMTKLKVKELSQLGGSTATTNPEWKGTDKTPKTDIIGSGKKISLKKATGGQLMSAGQAEAISTFEAAMGMYAVDSKGKRKILDVIDSIETDMGRMTTRGTIGSIEDLRDSGKTLSKADQDRIAEMEGLQLNAKELTDKLGSLFTDNTFKSYFCWEAATGTVKFKPSPDAIANVIVKFNETGTIKDYLLLDSPLTAGKTLAKGNDFFVSFKTGAANSRPYLALRSRNIKPKEITEGTTFRQIVIEELQKENFSLNESALERLDEFAVWNKIKTKTKKFSSSVTNAIKRVYLAVMKRIKEAFNFIKTLGAKMINGLLNFLGLSVSNVRVVSGGKYPL